MCLLDADGTLEEEETVIKDYLVDESSHAKLVDVVLRLLGLDVCLAMVVNA